VLVTIVTDVGLRQNYTGVKVYHQDINTVLEHSIKLQARLPRPDLKDLNGSSVLPAVPMRDEIECIIVGFPWCVPHLL
jgi:hypothetical protein